MFTRRHYEAIAKRISRVRRETPTAKERGAVDTVARALADGFSRDNERFSRVRFLRACGLIDE